VAVLPCHALEPRDADGEGGSLGRRPLPRAARRRRHRGRDLHAHPGEFEAATRAFFDITQAGSLLESNPALARSIRNRFPYMDPLNHLQIELLKRHRSGDSEERVRRGIHLTINGLAAGLRNSG